MDGPNWDATVFSKNRRHFVDGKIVQEFLEPVFGRQRNAVAS